MAERILVAQMTRMGDMLQTSPLIRSLRLRYPEAHIAVMLRRMGEAIAERHPDIDEIIVYDEDRMFINLRSRDSDKLLRAYEQADGYVKRLADGRFDVAYNCTQSIGSAMLLKLAGIPEVVGAHLSDDWQFVLRGRWTNYFFTSVYHRAYSNINLCDMFRHLAEDAPSCRELVFEVQDEDRAEAKALLEEHGVTDVDFLACFQLGASHNEKRWPELRFAGLARLLRERYGAKVALVGVEEEAAFGEELMQHDPGPVMPLFGRTGIPVLAALLERANILVTNDTGTMHIAAAVGCPIVLVSVGPVHFRETGPYGVGHCAIERRRDVIVGGEYAAAEAERRAEIRPQQVERAVEVALSAKAGEGLVQVEDCEALANVVLYRSAFAPDGCLEWYPVVRCPIVRNDLVRAAYRAMWLDFLPIRYTEEEEAASFRELASCYLAPVDGGIETWRDTLDTTFGELAGLGRQGVAETAQLIELLQAGGGMSRAQEIVGGLVRLDEQIRLYGEVHPGARPLAAIARFERDNLEGADALLLAQTTLQIYEDLVTRADLMRSKFARFAAVWSELRSS